MIEMPRLSKCSLKTAQTCQKCENAKNNSQARRKMHWKLLITGQTCQNAENTLESATTHTRARACGILVHLHLTTLLASKIRLAHLVVNSVKLHSAATYNVYNQTKPSKRIILTKKIQIDHQYCTRTNVQPCPLQ